MERYQQVLDQLSKTTGHLYFLQLININNHETINIHNLNSKRVLVEDCTELNGVYNSLSDLQKIASYAYVNGGEIVVDSMGGEITLGHYKYIE